MTHLSERILSVEPSPTLAVSARAKSLKAKGVDVVSFAAGEPDFPTPKPIVDACIDALHQGHTGYIAAAGLPKLREAVANDYKLRNRDVTADQVIITVGGKQALYNATQVVFNPGDKVLIPAPYWVSYPAMVKLAGANPIIVEPNAQLKVTPEILQDALKANDNVKGLMLCSPCNPTGVVYTKEELKALGDLLEAYPDVLVFFDAIYDRLCYETTIAADFAESAPALADRTLTFNGFSKAYSMTGWRLGYVIAPLEIAKKIAILQSQSTSNATTFAQYGALEALNLTQDKIDSFVSLFKTRRDLLAGYLDQIDGITYAEPHGAFYLFADFKAYIGDGKPFATCEDLVIELLEKEHVAAVHGAAFGAPGYVRFSYATSDDAIKKGGQRLVDFFAKLKS